MQKMRCEYASQSIKTLQIREVQITFVKATYSAWHCKTHYYVVCPFTLNYESEMFYSIDFKIPIVRNIAVVLINFVPIVAEVTKCRKELYLMLKKPLFHRWLSD